MLILAIDTSALVCSAALVDDTKTIGQISFSHKKTHSQTIMPIIHDLCKTAECDLKTVDYIAVSNGPGSFTGLRIGAATAKGLAYGLNKEIIPVPTLDALAYNIFSTDSIIVPIMDARRQQVYTAFYKWEGSTQVNITGFLASDINAVLEDLREYGDRVIFLGDGVQVHKETILGYNNNYLFAPQSLNMQMASSVGALAFSYASMGRAVGLSEFNVFYLRQSQAERTYEEREQV